MNAETAEWSRRYQTALGRYLQSGSEAGLRPALTLGRRAVTLEMETPDVVGIHTRVLATFASPGDSLRTGRERIERAEKFLAKVLVPIEKARLRAMKAKARMNQLTQRLHRRMVEAAASNHRLKRGVTARQAAEAALKTSGKRRATLLAEAHRLQKHLRQLMHEMLLAQESERRRTSLQLREELAQPLLAIMVRLLTLKRAVRADTEDLEKEIDETQRLVENFSESVGRQARKFEGNHEA